MMALNSMIIKSEIECNTSPRNTIVCAPPPPTQKPRCAIDAKKSSLAMSTAPNSGGKMGSRRIFTPQFKLQVLDSYRTDSDCKGNQRATARKYGIHRRQIQKWLQVEQTLRTVVANNLANGGGSTATNAATSSINSSKLLTNHHHHHHHQQQQQVVSNNNVMLKNNYINPTTAELKISYESTTTRHRVAPNNNNNNSHMNTMKSANTNVAVPTQPQPSYYYTPQPYHQHMVGHQHHQPATVMHQPHTTVLYHDVAPPSSSTTSLPNAVGFESLYDPAVHHPLYPAATYPHYMYHHHHHPPPPSASPGPPPSPVVVVPQPTIPEFVPIRLPFLNENTPIDLSLPERRTLNRFYKFEDTHRPITPYNWQWKNVEDPAKPQLTDLSNAGCQAWDLSCRKRRQIPANYDNDDDGRGSTSGDSCDDGRPTPAKTVKLFQPYLLSDDELKERSSNKSTDPIIWSHHQPQTYIRSSLFVQDYAYPPATPTSPPPAPKSTWVSQGSPVSGYDSSTSISSVYSESAETLSNYSLDFKLQAIDAYYHDHNCQGSQKAVASKYNIDRQLIERWLQQEHDLRQRLVI